MKCADFDWKGYQLKEMNPERMHTHERHLAACADCQAEVELLQVTLATLHRLPQAEPPRRISFVSDPVVRAPWWRRFLESGPQVGFASAAMLSLAIWGHAILVRPAAPGMVAVNPPAQSAELEARIQAEVDKRLPVALLQMQKQNEVALARVAELEKRQDDRRRQDLKEVRESFGYLERQLGLVYRNASQVGGD